MKTTTAALIAVLIAASGAAFAGETRSAPGARVYFVDLADGAKVKSPVLVHFGLSGMGIAPAGVDKEATGHHHLLVDTKLTPADLTTAIPADENHLHFGKGQTEVSLKLAPGRHTLQLVLADHNHVPHDPAVTSDVITIDVVE